MPDLFSGLVSGFYDAKQQREAIARHEADQATAREQAIFQHLLSADDPETAHLALAGLLDSAQPRKKAGGLKGWIGETMASPYLAQIQTLLNTPVRTEETVPTGRSSLPSTQMASGMALPTVQPSITEPAGDQPVAMPATSPTQAGSPPPTPVRYTQAPPTPEMMKRIALRPREAFLPPMEKYKREQVAKNQADIEGDIAALEPYIGREEAVKEAINFRLNRRGTSGMGQSVAGEAPDASGAYIPTFGVFDRPSQTYVHPGTTTPIAGFRPRTTTASTSMGVAVEPLARAMFGKKGSELSQPEMAQVLEASKLQKGQLTPKDAISAAQRFLPNATIDQQMGLADALLSGTQAPVGQGATAGPPAPGSTPTAAPGGATAPSTTPPPPAPTAAPQAGPPKLSSVIPPGMGTASKETGKPLPPQAQQAIVRTRAMNDTIDRALKALDPYKQSTNLEDTMKLVEKYRMGTEGDPLGIEAAQLGDLAGLQQAASASIGGTSRSQRIYADKRQHTPRIPSGRQIMFAHGTTGLGLPGLGAERVQKLSQMRQGDEGGFDSPSEIYQKLVSLKKANDEFLRDVVETAQPGTIQPMASHGAPTAGPGSAYKDANGVWHIRQ